MSEEKKGGIEIPTSWRIKRYYLYAAVTVIALVLPWITVDGNHFFLLSFDKLKLHLAFIQFDMQELYLMPFLLMIMFLGIFGMTVMGGRVFCGWVCPQTVFRVIYRDLIETKILGLRKRIKNKQQEPDMSKTENKVKKVIAILLWTLLSLIAGADFLWYFVPPEDFFAYLSNPSEHMTLIGSVIGIAVFLVYDIIFLKENFCVYVCPYSRVQSVLYDDHTVMALYNPHRGGGIYDEHHNKLFTKQKDLQAVEAAAECTTCESCVTVCPTHIDIRKGLQLECINCLECVDACTTVMGKLGKESLVTWSSDYEIIDQKGKTQYFRPKILAYIGLLVGLAIILGMMGSTKEHMLLNINKENRLYSVTKGPDSTVIVDNAYEFLLQNTENQKLKYFFEVIPPKGMEGKITIAKPSSAFTAVPGIKKKKIVVLRTTELLVENDRQDTVIPITIRAYALGHEDKIVVFRNSTFTFPRLDIIQSAE
ncbi:cytochrome c oxidase accessory protein CcoG [bacterium]|nr:cytochrome c oxidase accessory protein CcoG [bacterium]MBU1990243.1 cytochrome c oxidase accessory protein CcoG [bacterium]